MPSQGAARVSTAKLLLQNQLVDGLTPGAASGATRLRKALAEEIRATTAPVDALAYVDGRNCTSVGGGVASAVEWHPAGPAATRPWRWVNSLDDSTTRPRFGTEDLTTGGACGCVRVRRELGAAAQMSRPTLAPGCRAATLRAGPETPRLGLGDSGGWRGHSERRRGGYCARLAAVPDPRKARSPHPRRRPRGTPQPNPCHLFLRSA